MRRYETIIITDPDLSAEQREPIVQRVQDVITQGNGYLALTDDWGARKLAYAIKKKERGHYIRFDFCGTGAEVAEMERFFRIDDRILKYMTVLLEETADIEKIKEEIAAAQKKIEASEEQAQSVETPPPEKTGETTESKSPEESAVSAETQAPVAPVDPDTSETPETEAGKSKADPAETTEEIK